MLPHIRPGGVYICEDIHGEHNGFLSFMQGLVGNLNTYQRIEPGFASIPTGFQTWIHSIHFYPYATVIERTKQHIGQFSCPKRGTEWEPFL